MKLTKQKLEQLIMEEYKSMSRKVFDKRREFPEGGLIRAYGGEDQPINRPDLQDKLTALGSSGPEGYNQALDLADTLDEPLDIELDPNNMKTMQPHKRNIDQLFDDNQTLHFDFLVWGDTYSFEEKPDIGKVYQFAKEKGLDPEETYKKIMSNHNRVMSSTYINPPKTDYERNKEFKKQLEKQFGADLRSYREKYGY